MAKKTPMMQEHLCPEGLEAVRKRPECTSEVFHERIKSSHL